MPKSAMHVDVSDILRQGEGAQTEFTVEGETPELEEITLARPVSGTIRIVAVEEGVVAASNLETAVTLECDRCLRAFTHPLELAFEAEFADRPNEDQFPIDRKGGIDLSEPLRQEIEVRLPAKRLCQADCEGIELKQKKDS